MRSAVLALTLLLLFAPAASAQSTEEAVAELQDDQVYVDPTAESSLSSSEESALEQRVRGEDIYLAVLPAAYDDPEVLAGLADEVDAQATYGFLVGNQLQTRGSDATATAARDAVVDRNPASAGQLFSGFVNYVQNPETIPEGNGGDGDAGGIGGLILLGAAGVGGVAILASRRRRRREDAAELEEVKDNVRDDLVALGDDIRALDLDVQMPGVDPRVREHYGVAVEAYDRANQRWQTARSVEELEPVGSALEEGRYEMTAAKALVAGRQVPERRPPCFFDPRHGPSSRDVEWAPPGGAPREVPACEADAQRVEHGDDPEAREVMVGGRRMPYWQAGPAYAPFVGGFFGAGLFPGLMIGTMMGSSLGWGAGDAYGGDFGGGDFGGGDFGGGGGFGGGDFGGGGGFGGGDF